MIVIDRKRSLMDDNTPFQIEQDNSSVVTVRFQVDKPGWEQWCFFRSDAHHDNKYCRKDVERAHLEEAKKRNALIFDFGDTFCAMQGRFDRRLDYDQMPDELRPTANTYLDEIVRYNAEFYLPYANNWALLAAGNHESAVLKNHQTSLTERLAERLRVAGSQVKVGDYQGWIRLMFLYPGNKCHTYRVRYTHGYAGGGPVMKDAIQANRQMVFLDGVDFLISGHTHDSWHIVYRREGLNAEGHPYLRDVECIKMAGYKEEYSPNKGWAVEKGHPPKPLGGWWVRFFYANQKIQYELIRAKE